MLLIRNLKDTSDANDLHKYIKVANKRTGANAVKLAQIREADNYVNLLFHPCSPALDCDPKRSTGPGVISERK